MLNRFDYFAKQSKSWDLRKLGILGKSQSWLREPSAQSALQK